MADIESEEETTAELIAEPVAKALLLLFKQRVRHLAKSEDRGRINKELDRIAEIIKKRPKTLQSLMYENRGGFALRVAAVIVAYDIKPGQIEQFFEDLKLYLPKISPAKKSDLNWSELDHLVSENEKVNWTEAIKVLKRLELRLDKDS